jgi:small-conductance mechanosensitive channel
MTSVPGQWEKVIATVFLIGLAFLLSHLWSRYLARGEISAEKRRMHLVWARNVIWSVALLVITSVWASTIAGFALSLAAVAGALLIVSKELVMCVHGYLYVTLVQPFKVGDVIEFGAMRGRVIDLDMFATTLADVDEAGQLTGRVAEFPNGLLLTTPLKNISPAGRFVLHHIRMPLSKHATPDLERLETAAMDAAQRATQGWTDDAVLHFRQISEENFITFPSGKTRVFWDFSHPEHLVLVVRVACPSTERHAVEQAVFRGTWKAMAPLALPPEHVVDLSKSPCDELAQAAGR